jgi:quercetin dioxygenase-like cupin family protein
MRRLFVGGLLVAFAAVLCFGTASVHAQSPSQLKVTILVATTPITGVPDKVFVMLSTEFPPGVSTGRHTHPGDEYGTLLEGSVMTRQEGGEWKTVNAGQSYMVPANVIHETKNVGTVTALAVNAFVLEKDKPRVTPVQ